MPEMGTLRNSGGILRNYSNAADRTQCTRILRAKMIHMLLAVLLQANCCLEKSFAMKETFCADLSNRPLSIEELEKMFPLFGSTDDVLQHVTSNETKEHFKEVLSEGCLGDFCEPVYQCRENVRARFYDLAIDYFGTINGQNLSLVPKPHFMYYVNRIATPPSYGVRTMFELACVIMCPLVSENGMMNLFKCACPDPCKRQKACSVENCIQHGYMEHQFECNCDEGFEWNAEIFTCVNKRFLELRRQMETQQADPYELTGCKYAIECDEAGTLFCTTDVTGLFHTCICKPHYTGQFCTERVDACRDRVRHAYLPGGGMVVAGDTACNVNSDKNMCRSYLSAEGFVSYRCNCDETKWIPDPSLTYDNCLKRRTTCDSLMCVNGKCVTSERGTQSYCLCNPGYRGESCSQWVGEWTEWSAWDRCSPACGDVRYSVRSRDCLSMRPESMEKIECLGASIEYAECDEHPCARTEGTFVNTYFSIRQNGIAASVVAAAVACAVICGVWSLFCWSIVSRLVLGTYRKFQQRVGQMTEARVRHSLSLETSLKTES
ncbi:unnamed protein product [Dicrocoelium dendriticum]|nr:unnamed protein product [Dicrocoelium dendriticum]